MKTKCDCDERIKLLEERIAELASEMFGDGRWLGKTPRWKTWVEFRCTAQKTREVRRRSD